MPQKENRMSSDDEKQTVEPTNDPKQLAIEVAAFATSALPYVGGPISSVLSGVGTVRRINRIREVVDKLATNFAGFKSEVTENYVKTEEFEELLERTLRQVSDERSEEKRRIYAAFLVDDIKTPGPSYDEKVRFLRTLEELNPDHLRVLRALSAPPDANSGTMGSPNQTLLKRLPQMNDAHLSELVAQLNGMRVTNLQSLKVMMTGHGAADLRHAITEYGHRFLKYLQEA
jgi:hypothetical protein